GDEPGEMPPPVVNIGMVGAVQVGTGLRHTCALLMDGNVKCWGAYLFGVLGRAITWHIGDSVNAKAPPNVVVGGAVLSIVAGSTNNCPGMQPQQLLSWGDNSYAKLGIASTIDIGDDAGEMPPMPTPIFD